VIGVISADDKRKHCLLGSKLCGYLLFDIETVV
jgi:hypothetical protein